VIVLDKITILETKNQAIISKTVIGMVIINMEVTI
jgi:hypothetical protein